MEVVPRRDLEPACLGAADQPHGLVGIDGERLLDVDMAPGFQTLCRERKVAPRRCRDVNDIRPGRREERAEVRRAMLDPVALRELSGHERFPVTDADNGCVRDPGNGLDVLIGDLAAADDGDSQHDQRSTRTNSK